jgi:hypothetical protein
LVLPGSEAADDLQDVEQRLLGSAEFNTTAVAQLLLQRSRLSSQTLSACDSHSQRAMLLMEIPVADAALRSGATTEFDRHILSLEVRTREVLNCTPRDSFVWLLAFNLEILHGRLNDHAFDLLEMSYETSPNDAWISTRRIMVAAPLISIAPESLRRKILSEFLQLVRSGFEGAAARAYLTAPEPMRSLLIVEIEQLASPRQKAFSDALQKLQS